ncbi:hypothetical protein [Mesorhizobium sp.]|uniref:hypothetical protein n=1 Tax=Mesorhizobium sp. TaxID=1871066 RepID=UPI000FE49253|nr:hypothetical protein [Mesorhizobium sp.]RWC25961.1 MAG: hypothetical protein EOS70_32670 [Mesorhizobium sp.]RWE60627.1 MAG: hypothetical protein EOS67_02410 [Mesorhizobium sp.]RWE64179.1 MAG: hypothetical protein EOS62_30535 [Mesorhizobium sp.]RWE91480.1 MAG: hypothetical protein EOS43_32540 [Mesorhizobium sp.]TIS75719.1 MAG: hypothetical protein E5W94_20355 [Mesorhizobium sp.]
MQQINDTKKLVKQLDERARQSLIRIKETEELIEQNRRLTKRSRGILARASVLAAALGRTNDRP